MKNLSLYNDFKMKFVLLLFVFLFVPMQIFSQYYSFDDTEYRERILENRIICDNWSMLKDKDIPERMKKYIVSSTNIDSKKYDNKRINLIPNIVLQFFKDNTFNYLWRKNKDNVLEIKGNWEIRDALLILTLDKKYAPNYVKGTEFRYKILEIENNKIGLKLEGMKYPDLEIIKKTSDSVLDDLEKIVVAKEAESVSKKLKRLKTSSFTRKQDKEDSGQIEKKDTPQEKNKLENNKEDDINLFPLKKD